MTEDLCMAWNLTVTLTTNQPTNQSINQSINQSLHFIQCTRFTPRNVWCQAVKGLMEGKQSTHTHKYSHRHIQGHSNDQSENHSVLTVSSKQIYFQKTQTEWHKKNKREREGNGEGGDAVILVYEGRIHVFNLNDSYQFMPKIFGIPPEDFPFPCRQYSV